MENDLANEIKCFFAMQKTDVNEFELFCRKESHFRVQTKQMNEMQGHRCSKSSFSVREKLLNAILRA